VSSRTARDLNSIRDQVYTAQAEIRAYSAVAEYTYSELAYLARLRMDLELQNPAASAELSAIANITSAHIARAVMRFGSEW